MKCLIQTVLKASTLALAVATFAAIAQPVNNIDQATNFTRSNILVPNTYRYEPILSQRSASPSGIFNSSIIFIGDQLDRNMLNDARGKHTVITTFVDLNNLSNTSAFGRLIGENLMHELQVKGWTVTDVRMTRDLIVNPNGEFTLSRDIKRLHELYAAANVVTGTYTNTKDGVLINVRVLDLASGQVVSSAQTRFIKDSFVSSMIDVPQPAPTVKLTN